MSESHRSTFYDRFYLWIFIASLVSIYPITLSVIKSEETNNNNIKQWLPENNFDETKIYAEFRAHFGTVSTNFGPNLGLNSHLRCKVRKVRVRVPMSALILQKPQKEKKRKKV